MMCFIIDVLSFCFVCEQHFSVLSDTIEMSAHQKSALFQRQKYRSLQTGIHILFDEQTKRDIISDDYYYYYLSINCYKYIILL